MLSPEQLRDHVTVALQKADAATAALTVSMHELRIVEVELNHKHPCALGAAGGGYCRRATLCAASKDAMITPTPKIWLYPKHGGDQLEIHLFGSRIECAKLYSQIWTLAEAWLGWQTVEPLVCNEREVCGLHVTLGPHAHAAEALLEGYAMMSALDLARSADGDHQIEWTDGMRTALGVW